MLGCTHQHDSYGPNSYSKSFDSKRFRKLVLDISRFISHTLRLSWAAAFAQHTFCLSNTRPGEQKNCQKEDKNKIHKYKGNYLSKQGSILRTHFCWEEKNDQDTETQTNTIMEVSDQKKIYIIIQTQEFYNASTKKREIQASSCLHQAKEPQNSVRLY